MSEQSEALRQRVDNGCEWLWAREPDQMESTEYLRWLDLWLKLKSDYETLCQQQAATQVPLALGGGE